MTNFVIEIGLIVSFFLAFAFYIFYETASFLISCDASDVMNGYSTKTEEVVNEELEKAFEEAEREAKESGTNSDSFYKGTL